MIKPITLTSLTAFFLTFLILVSIQNVVAEDNGPCINKTKSEPFYEFSGNNITLNGTVEVGGPFQINNKIYLNISNTLSLEPSIYVQGSYKMALPNCSKIWEGFFFTTQIKQNSSVLYELDSLFCEGKKIDCLECNITDLQFSIAQPSNIKGEWKSRELVYLDCTQITIAPVISSTPPSITPTPEIPSDDSDYNAIFWFGFWTEIIIGIIAMISRFYGRLLNELDALAAILPILLHFLAYSINPDISGFATFFALLIYALIGNAIGNAGGAVAAAFLKEVTSILP